MDPFGRIIVLIDMDCFYCQVEEKLNPQLKDQPIAVVQYNAWRGGGIIAVNYPAREQGVTRHMRGNDAKKKCPTIKLVRVPEVRGKADLTKYRNAGKEIADVLATFTPFLERASVDEAYLDITELVYKRIGNDLNDLSLDNLTNTFVVGYDLKDFLDLVIKNRECTEDNLKLLVGGLITEEIRREVYNKTGYKCSAGIAHNKILAKLVCSLHKPNKQTILPQETVDNFFETMPINKIRSLGGKFGQKLSEDLGITFMGQLKKFTEKELAQKYDTKSANWLYNIARGIDLEPVTTKLISKSIACCKNFPGKTALVTAESVQYWLNELANELSERLETDLKQNNRKAKQMIVSFTQEINDKDVNSSRTHILPSYDQKKIGHTAFEIVKRFCLKINGTYHLKFLGLNASHFEDIKKVREITSFFKSKMENDELKNKNELKLLNYSDEIANPKSINQDINTEPNEAENNIYHQATQEFVENVEDLIFYDDGCRIKQEKSNEEIPNDSKSITFEKHNIEKPRPQHDSLSSFFQQYFYKEEQHGSFMKKDFDACDVTEESNDHQAESSENSFKICTECDKRIPLCEFLSHKDYHFASKLENDNHTSTQASKLTNHNKFDIKRKRTQKNSNQKASGNKDLLLFLNKTTHNPSELTEVCSECYKEIKVGEISNHKDYHFAKRIHLELNAASREHDMSKTKYTTINKVKKNNQSITSFFQHK